MYFAVFYKPFPCMLAALELPSFGWFDLGDDFLSSVYRWSQTRQ
jgi:hypothetical protein